MNATSKWHKIMSKLCVGCGLCLSVCPVNAIRIKSKDGIATVAFNYTQCVNCGKCAKICPPFFNLHTENMMPLNDLGKIIKVFFGYSTNVFIRYYGASGGVVTSLLIHALETEIVDEIFVVGIKGFAPYVMLTNNKNEIISAQGSIYFKTFSLAFLSVLLTHIKHGKRIAVVCLPCQALTLQRLLKKYREKLFLISLICNHVNEPWYLRYVLYKYLPKNAKPLAISSRKEGWPGGIKVSFKASNGCVDELTIPYITGFWGIIPSLNISAPLGCLICSDHLACAADIVIGDAWHPKYVGKNVLGVSIIIIRTEKGADVVLSAIRNGAIYCEEAELQDIYITQGHNVLEERCFAPFKKKLFQHRASAAYEFKEIDKILIALLIAVNYLISKYVRMRKLLQNRLVEKILKTILWVLQLRESMRLLQIKNLDI